MVRDAPITTGMVMAPVILSPSTSMRSKRTVLMKLFMKKK